MFKSFFLGALVGIFLLFFSLVLFVGYIFFHQPEAEQPPNLPSRISTHQEEGSEGSTSSTENAVKIDLDVTIPALVGVTPSILEQNSPKVSIVSIDQTSRMAKGEVRIVPSALSWAPGPGKDGSWNLIVSTTQPLDPGLYRFVVDFLSNANPLSKVRLPVLSVRTWFRVTKQSLESGSKVSMRAARIIRGQPEDRCLPGDLLLSGKVIGVGTPDKTLREGNRLLLVIVAHLLDYKLFTKKNFGSMELLEFLPPGNTDSNILGYAPIEWTADGFAFSVRSRVLSENRSFQIVVVCSKDESDEKCARRAYPISISHLSLPGRFHYLIPKNFFTPMCGEKNAVLYLYDFSKTQDISKAAMPEEIRHNVLNTFFDAK